MSKRLFIILPLLALLCSMLSTLVLPKTASALADGWVNRAVINYQGQVYTDNNTYDNTYTYKGPATDGCAPATINFGIKDGNVVNSNNVESVTQNTKFYYDDTGRGGSYTRAVATLTTEKKAQQGVSTVCASSRSTITIPNAQNRRITFVYKDATQNQISSIINGATFDRTGEVGGAARYVRTNDTEACRDIIVAVRATPLRTEVFGASTINGSATLYAVKDGPNSPKASESYKDVSGGVAQTCYISFPDDKYVDIMEGGYGLTAASDPGAGGAGALVANGLGLVGGIGYEAREPKNDDAFIIFIGTADANLQSTPLAPAAGAATNTTDDSPSCEASGFSLSWILCGISNGLSFLADWLLNNFVVPFLQPSPIGLDPADPVAGKTYQVWSAFRTYGNIILIIALLVAVISQAMGGGLVEAYTARKMLPRILASAILINISIYVVAFSVDISRVVGNGLQNLITAPLQVTGNYVLAIDGTSGNIIGGAITAIVVAAFASGVASGIIAYLPVILLFVLVPAVLAVLGVFITGVLLQGIIIALVITAPVAFALYCLPNTEKYFHTWWDWFFRALLVFPIIMTIIGIAKLMTVMIQQA